MADSDNPPASDFLDGAAISFTVACAFITDPAGRVLIVKPNYRPDWFFVGGLVDRGEFPHQGCAREIKEEIGMDLPVGGLLVLDWEPRTEEVAMPLTFYLFDGGVIEDPSQIVLQAEELDEFAFVEPDAAVELLAPFNKPRVPMALNARRTGLTVYEPTTADQPA